MKNEFILEAPSNAELTRTAARDLTDRINTASEDLAAMLQRAHDGKAWQALGYDSWKSYLDSEIKISKQHAHRLLAFAETREEIQKSPVGDLPPPRNERQVRVLLTLPPQERPKVYKVAVEAAGGRSPTAGQVEAAVLAVTQATDTPEDEDRESEDFLASPFGAAYQAIQKIGQGIPMPTAENFRHAEFFRDYVFNYLWTLEWSLEYGRLRKEDEKQKRAERRAARKAAKKGGKE